LGPLAVSCGRHFLLVANNPIATHFNHNWRASLEDKAIERFNKEEWVLQNSQQGVVHGTPATAALRRPVCPSGASAPLPMTVESSRGYQ